MKTRLFFLFAEAHHPTIDWNCLFKLYPELQTKRLSWRHADPLFGDFIHFLETHGPDSALEEKIWQQNFFRHLDYLPNQHFLFMLWLGLEKDQGNTPPLETWLPSDVGKKFCRWQREWEADQSLMQLLPSESPSPGTRPLLTFRGITLDAVFNYRILPELISSEKKVSGGRS